MFSPDFVKHLSQWQLPSLCLFRYCLTPNISHRNPACDYMDTPIPILPVQFLILMFCKFKEDLRNLTLVF